ncbi:MAG: hypothetical protein ABJE10_18315 [bacterium]
MFRTSMLGRRRLAAGVAALLTLIAPTRASGYIAPSDTTLRRAVAAPPTAKEFMLVLDARFQKAKPAEIFKRTIVFRSVTPGTPVDDVYPFVVNATVHDYTPGWPPEHFYGKTCIARINGWKYTMKRNEIREWSVDGRVAISDTTCVANPAEAVSAFPLDSIPGSRVGSSAPLPALVIPKPTAFILTYGEYACIETGGRIIKSRGFRIKRDKTYTDAEGTRGGTYVLEPFVETLTFHGGFLDGVKVTHIKRTRSFSFPDALTCAPWQ